MRFAYADPPYSGERLEAYRAKGRQRARLSAARTPASGEEGQSNG